MKKVILSLTLFVTAFGIASLVSCDNVDDYNSNIHDPAIPAAAIQAVDLNLPSGTKWSNMNLGAATAYDYGTYYTWNADIVSQVWGSEWTLPTREQLQELYDGCTWDSFTYNGKSLIVGTSKYAEEGTEPAKIYIALSGQRQPEKTATQYLGSRVYFWTSEENADNTENAYCVYAMKGKSSYSFTVEEEIKTTQNVIRPVKK